MKRSTKESIIVMFIFYGLSFILICFTAGGFVLPTLAWDSSGRSKAEIYIVGGSWIGLLLLSLVGCYRIAGYFCTPKEYRGDFWFIQKTRRFKTIDLSEIERESDKEREAKTVEDSKSKK